MLDGGWKIIGIVRIPEDHMWKCIVLKDDDRRTVYFPDRMNLAVGDVVEIKI